MLGREIIFFFHEYLFHVKLNRPFFWYTALFLVQPKAHGDPRNEVESQIPADNVTGLELGKF